MLWVKKAITFLFDEIVHFAVIYLHDVVASMLNIVDDHNVEKNTVKLFVPP